MGGAGDMRRERGRAWRERLGPARRPATYVTTVDRGADGCDRSVSPAPTW